MCVQHHRAAPRPVSLRDSAGVSKVSFTCPPTGKTIGLPLTADSLEELGLMSFPGVVIEECPACGQDHEVDLAACFLSADGD